MKKKKNQSEANIKPVTSISSEQGVESVGVSTPSSSRTNTMDGDFNVPVVHYVIDTPHQKLFDSSPIYTITTYEKGSRSMIKLEQKHIMKILELLRKPWDNIMMYLKINITAESETKQYNSEEDFMQDAHKYEQLLDQTLIYNVECNEGSDSVDISNVSFFKILQLMEIQKLDAMEFISIVITSDKFEDYNNKPNLQRLLAKSKLLSKFQQIKNKLKNKIYIIKQGDDISKKLPKKNLDGLEYYLNMFSDKDSLSDKKEVSRKDDISLRKKYILEYISEPKNYFILIKDKDGNSIVVSRIIIEFIITNIMEFTTDIIEIKDFQGQKVLLNKNDIPKDFNNEIQYEILIIIEETENTKIPIKMNFIKENIELMTSPNIKMETNNIYTGNKYIINLYTCIFYVYSPETQIKELNLLFDFDADDLIKKLCVDEKTLIQINEGRVIPIIIYNSIIESGNSITTINKVTGKEEEIFKKDCESIKPDDNIEYLIIIIVENEIIVPKKSLIKKIKKAKSKKTSIKLKNLEGKDIKFTINDLIQGLNKPKKKLKKKKKIKEGEEKNLEIETKPTEEPKKLRSKKKSHTEDISTKETKPTEGDLNENINATENKKTEK